jgi:hypothetical protein
MRQRVAKIGERSLIVNASGQIVYRSNALIQSCLYAPFESSSQENDGNRERSS